MSSAAIYPPSSSFRYKRQLDLTAVDFDIAAFLESQQNKRYKTQPSVPVYVTLPQLVEQPRISTPILKDFTAASNDPSTKREKLQNFVNKHLLSVMLKNEALLHKLCLAQYIETQKKTNNSPNSFHTESMVIS